MDKSHIMRRGFYLFVSLGGVAYELLQAEQVRWPLLAGYGFIIIVTTYSFYVQGSKPNEDRL